jgi:hypothetical protein
MSQYFALGVCTVIFGLLVPAFYGVRLGVMAFGSWVQRKPFTQERKGVIAGMLLVVGLVFGSFVQPQYDNLSTCRADGKTVVACFLKTSK